MPQTQSELTIAIDPAARLHDHQFAPHSFAQENPLDRTQVLKLLTQHKAALVQRFGVTNLALFGSTVRNTARPDSDVDVLIAFDGPATSARYFGVQFYLEDLLGCPVDLVTDRALRPELRPYIEKEALYV